MKVRMIHAILASQTDSKEKKSLNIHVLHTKMPLTSDTHLLLVQEDLQ